MVDSSENRETSSNLTTFLQPNIFALVEGAENSTSNNYFHDLKKLATIALALLCFNKTVAYTFSRSIK